MPATALIELSADWIIAIGTVALAGATFWLVLGARRAARDAAKQLEITAKAAQLSAALEFMGEYRSFSMRLARLAVRKIPPHKVGRCLRSLPLHQYEAATRISNFLDHLGALVAEDLLAPKPAFSFLGGSALEMWDILGPYIYSERRAPGASELYQRHFEHLAAKMSAARIEVDLDERLEKLAPPEAG
jgi:hypothetical protein